MAKWEIPYRLGLTDYFWWRIIPGETIEVRWPRGMITIDDTMPQYDPTMSAARYTIDSADPNDHYRPWMEANVGRQGWDWDWKIGDVANDTLLIKVRRKHQSLCSIIALKWN